MGNCPHGFTRFQISKRDGAECAEMKKFGSTFFHWIFQINFFSYGSACIDDASMNAWAPLHGTICQNYPFSLLGERREMKIT